MGIGFDSVIANFLFELGLYPVLVLEPEKPGKNFKIPYDKWPNIVEQSKVKNYREIAKEYEVSYEAVRRVIKAASMK